MRDLLGGKGANVAEMRRTWAPTRSPRASRSPPRACVIYTKSEASPEGLDAALAALEKQTGEWLVLHRSGIDYVSCSPYRIAVARVAAAPAAIRAHRDL